MSKPYTNTVVRTCPQASAVVHRVDKRRTDSSPPDPPLPRVGSITDAERSRRVTEEGSRRKRDLAGHRRHLAALERERLGSRSAVDPALGAELLDRLRHSVPEATFEIWLAPLRVAGAEGTSLILAAPDGIRSWTSRRYARLLLEALEGTGYTEVEFISVGAK